MEKESHYRKTVRHQKKIQDCNSCSHSVFSKRLCRQQRRAEHTRTKTHSHSLECGVVGRQCSTSSHFIVSYRIALNCIVSYRMQAMVCVCAFVWFDRKMFGQQNHTANESFRRTLHTYFLRFASNSVHAVGGYGVVIVSSVLYFHSLGVFIRIVSVMPYTRGASVDQMSTHAQYQCYAFAVVDGVYQNKSTVLSLRPQ